MGQEEDLERAHHQAGRAVICVTLFGARVVKLVSIEGDLESAGGFETYSNLPVPLSCRPPSHKRGEERKPIAVDGIIDAHGVLAYAGIAAVDESRRQRDVQPASDDALAREAGGIEAREQFSKLAASIGRERPAEHFYEEYWKEAQRLLSSSWHSVDALTESLLQHRTLNGRRVDALILGEETQ